MNKTIAVLIVAILVSFATISPAFGQQPDGDGALAVSGLRVEPQRVEEGGRPSVIVEVTNSSTSTDGSLAISLEIDGQVFETRTVSVSAGTLEVLTLQAPELSAGTHSIRVGEAEARYIVGGSTEQCTLRQGMQPRLQNVVDTITKQEDGHVELSFRNPGVNDCSVDADLRITVPTNIIPFAKDGVSGAAGTLNSVVSNVGPGVERVISMDFKCQRAGTYMINFLGTYWPTGQKDLFQPITLQQRLVCREPSGTLVFDDPAPAPAPVSAPAPAPAPAPVPEPAAATSPNGTTDLVNDVVDAIDAVDDSSFPVWVIGLVVVLVIFGIVAVVAMVALGGKKGGTITIKD